ncbi:DUF4468 domain-containing protein [Hymenobacter arizonensis]|uniref:Uncharacterized protein n=1 Tax=Hymenobacter arizonensis TaxID=1227077 RepID=A0A1I6BDR1_HYMAR|nr:DUF4468 domain-containing protein [Hymenobacter arizonensis]SFQ79044.1 protein of unknown function [Hymenobacter arizonensis]
MKRLLLAVGLLLALPAAAQFPSPPIDSARGKITYAALLRVPEATQAQLYDRAFQWLATVEAPNTHVPPVTDAVNGVLSANAGMPFLLRAAPGSFQATLWRELRITVQPGAVRCEMTGFLVQPYVASATWTLPTDAQLKLTPAEQYLDRSNRRYYDAQGHPTAHARSVLGAMEQQSAALLASLRAALAKPVF